MREKLIELFIQEHERCQNTLCYECKYDHDEECGLNALVDYLIANGVTIPVHCHECKHWKNEINGCTEDKRFCDVGFYMVHKAGFCSFGEKKTENE